MNKKFITNMSPYLLITIIYLSCWLMVLNFIPGQKRTIQYITGTISIVSYEIIEVAAQVSGVSINEIINIGFGSISYVKKVLFIFFGLWICLMFCVFVSIIKKKKETKNIGGLYVQEAGEFR